MQPCKWPGDRRFSKATFLASLAGQKFEKYEVLHEVGHGGMAVVYRARDTVLQREVAIKVLHAHLADRAESRERLKREAITVAKLRHDNIVEIYDSSGEDAEQAYLVTEFIHGRTLRAWIEDDYIPRPAVAALIARTLARALAAAHALNIVHRDIKPDNVMIRDDGCLKLMDFGIAQLVDQQKLTMTGQLLGSPAFMAPELISGRPVDHRIDVFSLGIMLYQLATGTLPFTGRNPHEVLNKIADCEFPRPSSVSPLVDEELEAIIAAALAREPAQRYATADELANALDGYLDAMGIHHGDDSELVAYFHAPAAYIEDLDRRVIERLMQRARDSADSGQSARAIRLLGRVLERDHAQSDARQMLESMRRRGRYLRHLLFAVAAVFVLSLCAIAFTLQGKRASPPVAMAPDTLDPAPNVSARRVVIPIQEGNPAAPVLDDDGDSDDATNGAGTSTMDPRRAAAPTERPTPSSRPPRSGKTISRPGAGDPTLAVCTIRVQGPPVSHLTHHQIVLAGRKFKFDGARRVFEVPIQTDSARVRLAGDRWEGTLAVDRASCSAGVVTLNAVPKPASIVFRDLPAGVGAQDVAVRCLSGCSEENFAHRWSTKVPFGSDRKKVRLLLTASRDGVTYRSERAFNLFPGANQQDARMAPIGQP